MELLVQKKEFLVQKNGNFGSKMENLVQKMKILVQKMENLVQKMNFLLSPKMEISYFEGKKLKKIDSGLVGRRVCVMDSKNLFRSMSREGLGLGLNIIQ